MEIEDHQGNVWEVKEDRFLRYRRGAYGLTDIVNRRVSIYPRQDLEDYIDTVIHEGLHVFDWHRDHEWVEQAASQITKMVIWALKNKDILPP